MRARSGIVLEEAAGMQKTGKWDIARAWDILAHGCLKHGLMMQLQREHGQTTHYHSARFHPFSFYCICSYA